MTEWQIARSRHLCSECEKAFQELESYYSALYETAEGFERRDFCMSCWKGPSEEMFSFWKTQVPAKAAKPKRFVDDEVLVDFFSRLEGATEDVKVNFRYILALVLMRKKLVKFEGTRRDESGEYLVVKLRGEDRLQEVRNPDLTEEQIQEVSQELSTILQAEFE